MTTGDYLVAMRTVGIKQLKAHLSEYVKAARQGEVFLVTDRDTVVAELRPAGSSVQPTAASKSIAATLNDLVDSGTAAAPTAPLAGWTWAHGGIRFPDGTAQQILDDLRADRE